MGTVPQSQFEEPQVIELVIRTGGSESAEYLLTAIRNLVHNENITNPACTLDAACVIPATAYDLDPEAIEWLP